MELEIHASSSDLEDNFVPPTPDTQGPPPGENNPFRSPRRQRREPRTQGRRSRRKELNDYLAIIAGLAVSYGGARFYTYHRLFSAKCAAREKPGKRTSVPGKFNFAQCRQSSCRYRHVCSYCAGAHAKSVCSALKNINKKFKKYLSTPIIVSALHSELQSNPNREFCDYLTLGLTHGFHPGVLARPTESFVCKNLQSAVKDPEVVTSLLSKEVESGFMIGPFTKPPFPVYRINPIGVATRKYSGKKRLIIDLSAPHNSTIPSINSLIPLEEFSLHYHSVDDAIALIKKAGRHCWLAKADITSAFKVMPIDLEFWHLFGVKWHRRYYFAVRLTFGCRSSPKIFDTLSEALCWILLNNYKLPFLVHLLDDFLVVIPHSYPPALGISTLIDIFNKLGVPLSEEKTCGPLSRLKFLDIILDTEEFSSSLPKEKKDRISLLLNEFITSPSHTKQEVLSLLGHLNFAMRIIPQGRPFISHLLNCASATPSLEDVVSLDAQCLADLKLWRMCLDEWNGLCMFYDDCQSSPEDLQLYTDAAPSIGFGGFFKGRWFGSPWPLEFRELITENKSSAVFELYPVVIAALLWGKEWTSKSVLIHSDNEAVVHVINNSSSKSPALSPLIRRLIWIAASYQFIIRAVHVPGCHNEIADSLSRLNFQRFRSLAPEADPYPTPLPSFSETIFL
ncbi:uncharacterized protein LOC121720877 [Alosa sapidissima]|uniref:uncharacterized protein LOC121720877 n=1 Tax=Alosa sapidissima TaxID=34773 RepID=UPI001C09B548|nr:uncharacterized protein LOC121720877 [Alosa sapidissima]